jgi:tetratricopeptide (TPR) repeat protein
MMSTRTQYNRMKSRITNTEDRYDLLNAYLNKHLGEEEEERLWEFLIRDAELYEDLVHLANVKQIFLEQSTFEVSKQANITKQGRSLRSLITHQRRISSTITVPLWKPVGMVLLVLIVLSGIFWEVQWPFRNLEQKLPLKELPLDVYRGGEHLLPSKAIDQIEEYGARRNYEMALLLIDEQLAAKPSVDQQQVLLLNQGVYRYNVSRHMEAIASFLTLLDLLEHTLRDSEYSTLDSDQALLERVKWYLAQSYYQMGEVSLALEYFEQVIELDGSYSRSASEYASFLREHIPQNKPNRISEDT